MSDECRALNISDASFCFACFRNWFANRDFAFTSCIELGLRICKLGTPSSYSETTTATSFSLLSLSIPCFDAQGFTRCVYLYKTVCIIYWPFVASSNTLGPPSCTHKIFPPAAVRVLSAFPGKWEPHTDAPELPKLSTNLSSQLRARNDDHDRPTPSIRRTIS